jgi:hypothetical protein
MLYQTPIGLHDGDSWERLCQVCLKIKYNGNYIEVPASPGDYGIDGYTTYGDAYQCYCPERECSDAELYASQRDKITRDTGKLGKYQIQLQKLLNGTTIKRWYLLTPKITTNDLLFHCAAKEEEIKKMGLPHIDPNFKVLPLNYEHLSAELHSALNALDYTTRPHETVPRISISGTEIEDDDVNSYKSDLKNSAYTQKAYRKHEIRYGGNANGNFSDRIAKQVDRTIYNLLLGDSILKDWESMYQDQFEKFNKVIKVLERKVEDLCDIPTLNSEDRYKEIQTLVSTTIDREFPLLNSTTRGNLSLRVVADWLLRCPLNFE